MQTEKVEVDSRFGPEFAGIYEFRQVSQGEYEDVLLSFMDALGKIAKKDLLKVNRKMLWISLIQQPPQKPLTAELLLKGDIPHGLSTRLQEAYDKANGLTPEETRFLSSQSDAEPQTQDSQSSPSAKDSTGPKQSTAEPAEKQSPSSP